MCLDSKGGPYNNLNIRFGLLHPYPELAVSSPHRVGPQLL